MPDRSRNSLVGVPCDGCETHDQREGNSDRPFRLATVDRSNSAPRLVREPSRTRGQYLWTCVPHILPVPAVSVTLV